jgi:pyridoxamine 5'-phosphate oxidase
VAEATSPHKLALPLLDERSARPDPLDQLRLWLVDAEAVYGPGSVEATAMALATADAVGRPSVRFVLLKGLDRGLVFYTNYRSRKARDLASNPRASAALWWPALQRQARVEGAVERLAAEESDAYFRTRPRLHQLTAWASPQSEVVPERAFLERRLQELDAEFPGEVPRPPFWGGYRLVPDRLEFWQGREGRLHDRLQYTRRHDGWVLARLAP